MRLSRNEARIGRAQKLRRQGYTFAAIARLMGISEGTAHAWADPDYQKKRTEQNRQARRRREGKPLAPTSVSKPAADPPPPKPSRSADKTREIIDLRRRGFSAQAIAAQLRVPYRQVEEALR